MGNSNPLPSSPLFSFSVCVCRRESLCCCFHCSGAFPPVYQIGRNDFFLCCSSVCGLWSLPFGKRSSLTLFHAAPGPTSSTHHICLDARQGQAPCSFISSVSECVGVSGAGALPSPSPLSPLSPTDCLSADVAWGRSGLWPSGPCVCVTFAPLNPMVMCYRWDLRLSLSARAARRRRKQDVRGSTVISQRALFHTIPGRSRYSLHTGLPLDIYMCQQSQRYWPN